MKIYHFILIMLWKNALADMLAEQYACCPNGETIVGRECQNEEGSTAIEILSNCTVFYLLDPSMDRDITFHVNDYGELMLKNKSIDSRIFCIGDRMELVGENMSGIQQSKVRIAIACLSDTSHEIISTMGKAIRIMLSMSIVGLILTFIVYAIVPELRNLQGLSIMCLCGSLALEYFQLIFYINITDDEPNALCYLSAFGVYYWSMASFFWMNVISIDLVKSVKFPDTNITDNRMFLYYNLYGWGMPLLFLLVIILATFKEGVLIHTGIGIDDCWLHELSTLVYTHIPVAILLILNIILFGIASRELWYKTSYNNVANVKNLKYKFCLYLKLLITVGLIWLLQLIFLLTEMIMTVWIVFVIINSLIGIVFFLILVVFRKKALKGLVKAGVPIPCISLDEIEEEDEIIEDENHT